MKLSVLNPRDLGAGLLYIGFGAAAVFLARDYAMGSAGRMGPAYFPTLLGAILVVFGLISIVRAFLQSGRPVGTIAWRPALFVIGSLVLFAAVLNGLGLILSLGLLIAGSAAASRTARLSRLGVLSSAGLVAGCALVFVKGLGLPIPLLGTWIGG